MKASPQGLDILLLKVPSVQVLAFVTFHGASLDSVSLTVDLLRQVPHKQLLKKMVMDWRVLVCFLLTNRAQPRVY